MRLFVSSAFFNLRAERDAAAEGLRRSQMVPWRMETVPTFRCVNELLRLLFLTLRHGVLQQLPLLCFRQKPCRGGTEGVDGNPHELLRFHDGVFDTG